MRDTLLSVLVVVFNMRREVPRTLFSLTPAYQRPCSPQDYEVIVIDHGSTEPLSASEVRAFGDNFRYMYIDMKSVSPAAAINAGVRAARGQWITICIDGARILSPGILAHTLAAMRTFQNPVVATLGWHLGHEIQQESIMKGYNQTVEDRLLDTVNWREDGYQLFNISCLAQSSRNGWFLPFSESNCITLSRSLYWRLDGMDENFQSVGGGLLNLDYFKRACETPGVQVVVLLGEGTFHQFHGGVSTNVPRSESPVKGFLEEYERLRGVGFSNPEMDPIYLGRMPDAAFPFLEHSAKKAREKRLS